MVNKRLLMSRIMENGLTQKQLAKAIGIGISTLSMKINNHTQFDAEEIRAICDRLKITNSKDKAEIFLSSVSQ